MNLYNKVMLYFWLAAAIVIFVITSYMSFTEGFKKWGFYYIFVGSALLMFLVKRWMMKRMEKHLAYMEEEKKKQK